MLKFLFAVLGIFSDFGQFAPHLKISKKKPDDESFRDKGPGDSLFAMEPWKPPGWVEILAEVYQSSKTVLAVSHNLYNRCP